MPEAVVVARPLPKNVVLFELGGTPPAPFVTWCDWAKAGLADALQGMKQAGGGVTEYHVGSRGLHRSGPVDQIKNVDYWNEMVALCCGIAPPLPGSLTGRDSACRIVPRDV
jgi:hypothetical protein